MLRVLVSAYACEPEKSSEPGVGWNWACQIARFNEVWVITRTNNRRGIEAMLAKNPIPNIRFTYFDLPPWLRFWKKGSQGVRLYYLLWQLGVYFVARRLHGKVGFDLVHHVTLVNYWMPSFLALLPPPFVLGPVGGGESAPRPFWWSFSMRGKVYESLRDLRRGLGHLDPFVRFAARRATVALAVTSQTAERLERLGCRKVSVISQVGLAIDEVPRRSKFFENGDGLFRVVSVGRMLHWKGFELGVRAFALLKARFPSCEYWLIGDGPERKRLEALSQRLGAAGSVRFLGSIPRPQVLEMMARCKVLINPSLHDSGGFVCAEAMAAGLPVICLDLGGPALQVTPETGIKIRAAFPAQVIADLAAAMHQLALDPARREHLSREARRRAREHFPWSQKGEWLNGLYSTATHTRE